MTKTSTPWRAPPAESSRRRRACRPARSRYRWTPRPTWSKRATPSRSRSRSQRRPRKAQSTSASRSPPKTGPPRSEFRAWSSSSSDSLRFATGQTTDWIKIRADDDTLNDDGETITLCLDDLPEPYATLAGRDCATINILDNDDPNSVQVSFDRGNYWASEDGNPAWPRISVHPVPDREIIIPITFTRGGGLSAADYEAVTTRVTFGPGLYGVHGDGHLSDNRTYASFPIEIWAIDDRDDDDDEYLDLTFGANAGRLCHQGHGLPPGRRQPGRVPATGRPVQGLVQRQRVHPCLGDRSPQSSGFLQADEGNLRGRGAGGVKEGLYETGSVATVRVQLSRRRDMESTVTIPITVTRHGTTTAADYAGAGIPSSITFLPGQTEYSFRVRAVNDDIDDDGEYLTLTFGTLPELVDAGDQASLRDRPGRRRRPPSGGLLRTGQLRGDQHPTRRRKSVYCQAAGEGQTVRRAGDGSSTWASSPKSTRGGGRHPPWSPPPTSPAGPHDGAHFDADETEFTVHRRT